MGLCVNVQLMSKAYFSSFNFFGGRCGLFRQTEEDDAHFESERGILRLASSLVDQEL